MRLKRHYRYICSNCVKRWEYVVEEIVKFMEEKLKIQEYENYVLSWIFRLKNWNPSNVNRRGIFGANIRVFSHFSAKETNILLRASQLIIRIGIRESSVMLSFDPLKFCQSILILQFSEQSTEFTLRTESFLSWMKYFFCYRFFLLTYRCFCDVSVHRFETKLHCQIRGN